MPGPSVGLSIIRYRPDLTKPQVKPIPLGVVVEIRTRRFIVMGLAARNALTTREREKLDGIALRQLTNPAEFIENEIDRVAAEDPINVLERLADEHPWSLQFTAPTSEGISDELARLDTPEEALQSVLAILPEKAEQVGIGKFQARLSRKGKRAPKRAARPALRPTPSYSLWNEPPGVAVNGSGNDLRHLSRPGKSIGSGARRPGQIQVSRVLSSDPVARQRRLGTAPALPTPGPPRGRNWRYARRGLPGRLPGGRRASTIWTCLRAGAPGWCPTDAWGWRSHARPRPVASAHRGPAAHRAGSGRARRSGRSRT